MSRSRKYWILAWSVQRRDLGMIAHLMALLYYRIPKRRRIPSRGPTYIAVSVEGRRYPIACVEIKTAVPRKSLDPHILTISDDMDVLFLGEIYVLDYIRKQHVVQLAQQLAITGCNFYVYAITSKVTDLKTMVVYCCNEKLAVLKSRVAEISQTYIQ